MLSTDKGVASHHAVTKDAGTGNLLVNKKDHGGYQTIQRLVAELGVSKPDWPVGLTNPIAATSKDATLSTTRSPLASAVTGKSAVVPQDVHETLMKAFMSLNG